MLSERSERLTKISNNYTTVNFLHQKNSKIKKKEFNSIINFDSTPVTVFLKNGEETTAATRIVGAKNEEYILAKLKSNGYINE